MENKEGKVTLPVWPEKLPSVQASGWSYTQKTHMVVSEMEMGPPKRRHRGSKSYALLKGTLLLSLGELNTFIQFVEQDIDFGTTPFLWPDFMTGEQRVARLSIQKDGDLYSVSEKKRGEFTINLELELEV